MSAEVYKAWTKAYSTFVGPITSTRFMEKGQLTPEEFVGAGDKLVDKCPSWKWCGAADGKEGVHKAMPKEKRFLVMSGARCERRAGDLTGDMGGDVELEGDEEGWTCTHKDHVASKVEEMPSMDDDAAAVPAKAAEPEELDEDDIPDMDMDMDAEVAVVDEDEDPAAVCTNTVVPARRYDIHILYDNYTYTPRVYLNGYGETGEPLSNEAMYEDIYSDYADKTATIETHPYTGASMVSIHPCRHAETMKRMIDKLREAHETRIAAEKDGASSSEQEFGISPDMSLFLFLKFISSVIPTIDYDFTASVDIS